MSPNKLFTAAAFVAIVTMGAETTEATTRRAFDREPESTPSTDGSDRVPTSSDA